MAEKKRHERKNPEVKRTECYNTGTHRSGKSKDRNRFLQRK